jgi:hypothetical protein
MPQHTFSTATASAHATSATPSSGLATERWPLSPVRYPDPAIQVLDPRFAKYRLGNAAVERLATGFRWAEGPVWFGDGRYLLWSDIPNNRIMPHGSLIFRVVCENRDRASYRCRPGSPGA